MNRMYSSGVRFVANCFVLCLRSRRLSGGGSIGKEHRVAYRHGRWRAAALPDGGAGPAVILLHGFAETSRMWRPIMPLLAEKFTVIAPDLPGIGDSSIPAEDRHGHAAKRIHELARS